MSNKRQATSNLNHDNWDREDEPEERGTFRSASEDELKNRIIKKAKRKIVPGTDVDAADGSEGTKSVFSGFSGFGKPVTSSVTTSSSSPFSFLSKIPAVAAGTTSSVVSSSTTTTSATPTFSVGSGLVTPSAKVPESSKSTSASTFSFGSALSTTASTTSCTTTNSISSHFMVKSSEYYTKLSSLNQAVSEWIKIHVDKNPVCILSPIFKDYEKYLKEIEIEKQNETKVSTPTTIDKTAETLNKPSTGIGNFKFSNSSIVTTTSTTTTSETNTKTNGFTFGLKNSEETQKVSKPDIPSTFSFGLKTSVAEQSNTTAKSTAASTSGFSFGITNNNPSSTPPKPFSFTPGATPFSFGNIKPPAPEAEATTSEADADENEEPPKNEFKQVVEDDAVYSKKCKVFVKKNGSFVDKGVGTLYLKPVESTGKTQLLVRADTNLGNILVNLILNTAIPTQRMGKNNVMMVCLPTPDVEKPTSMLLRVKTGEEADELLKNIDKYKN